MLCYLFKRYIFLTVSFPVSRCVNKLNSHNYILEQFVCEYINDHLYFDETKLMKPNIELETYNFHKTFILQYRTFTFEFRKKRHDDMAINDENNIYYKVGMI
jgi:hypothetical protein